MNKKILSIFQFCKNRRVDNSCPRFPLLWKIHSLMVTIIILAVGTITWVTIIEQMDNDRQHLLAKNRLILEQLASTVHSGFYTLNWGFVEDSIHKNLTDTDISYIHLIRPDKTLYLSSDDSIPIPQLDSGTGLIWEDKQHFFMTKSVLIGTESWQLILNGSTIELQNHSSLILYHNLLLGLVIILLSSLLTFLFSQRITRSLSSLSDVAGKLGRKEFSSRVTFHSNDEIGSLAEHINSMAELLEAQHHKEQITRNELEDTVLQRTRELQQTNNRLTSILHSTAQGFFRTDGNQIIREINPKTSEMLGRSQNELLGQHITNLTDNTNTKILKKQIRLRDKGQSTAYEIEFLHLDGHPIPCFCNATPLFNVDGQRTGAFAIVTDITPLKETQRLLQLAKEKAEESSRMKSSFLANMSHEIRTPLNGIIGSMELLNDQNLQPSRQRKLIHTVQKSADYLLILLNDILDLSKIESGKFEIDEQPFILSQLRNQLESIFITQCKEKNIHLQLTLDDSLPEIVVGDERLLKQICVNLLSNGIKFTSSGGRIALTLSGERNREGFIMLMGNVKDTGIGIATEHQTVIFETFSQADSSTTRNYGGSGLGLALCKKLCVLMGGDIRLQSVEHEGSTFFFSVHLKEASQEQLDTTQKNLHIPHSVTRDIPPLTILLVDDNDVNRDVAQMLLENANHFVTTACDGLEALELLAKTTFDCILMDIQMPRMDGVTAIKLIRICEQSILPPQDSHHKLLTRLHDKLRNSHTAVIALTANVFRHDRQKYLAAGMDGFLGKPVRPFEISKILSELSQDISSFKPLATALPEQSNTPLPSTLIDISNFLHTRYNFSSEQVQTLLTLSMNTIQEDLGELEKFHTSQKSKDIAECAHKLKGTLANIGLVSLADIASSIQQDTQNTISEKLDFQKEITAMRRELNPIFEEFHHSIELNKIETTE